MERFWDILLRGGGGRGEVCSVVFLGCLCVGVECGIKFDDDVIGDELVLRGGGGSLCNLLIWGGDILGEMDGDSLGDL